MLTRRAVMAAGIATAGLGAFGAKAAGRGGIPGFDLADMGRGIVPGDDFYRYVNGGWLARTTIPADRPSFDTFGEIGLAVAAQTRAILEETMRAPRNADAGRIGTLMTSLLDTATIEARGLQPVEADLDRIAAVDSGTALAAALARMCRDFIRDRWTGQDFFAPISPFRHWDIRDPSRYHASLVQGGLGLPDRSFYLDATPAFEPARKAYRTYLEALFALVGRADPAGAAARVMALETGLAKAQRPRVELSDVVKRNNVWSPAELAERAPGFDWPTYLEGVGFAAFDRLQVGDPEATIAFAVAARDLPLSDWRDYLVVRTLTAFAPYGPAALADAHFGLEATLRGLKQRSEPWVRASRSVDLAMGPAVGALYLERHLPPSSRVAVEQMAGRLKAAMARRIEAAAWMAPATKLTALKKLAAVRIAVGGDMRGRDYARLVVRPDDAWGNMVRSANHAWAHELSVLAGPVDRGEWELLPHSVNGQSNPILRTITMTAGVLQPIIFDAQADPAIQYGRIGTFIAHELTHQFDAAGAQFDETGAMRDWWAPEDKARFEAATAVLADQYSAYEPLPGTRMNGRLTLNENIADLGGVAIAYDAWRASLGGRDAPVLGGFTGQQLFFTGYASMWRRLTRPEALPRILATSGHSIGEWRAMTVRNHDAWVGAFGVREGAAMYLPPEKRARIW